MRVRVRVCVRVCVRAVSVSVDKKVAAHNEAVRARREAVKVETRLTLEAEVAKPAVAPVAPVAPKLGKKA